MTAYSAENWDTGGRSKSRPGLKIRTTNWGLAVVDVSRGKSGKSLSETAFKAVGLAMLPAGAIAAMPSIELGSIEPLVRLGLAAGFVTTGFGLFTYASRGFTPELHIDAQQRDVTLGNVNSKGRFFARKTLSRRDVQSFFLLRAKNGRPAHLCARSRKNGAIIKLMSGTEADLVPVLEQITEAFRPPNRKKGRVKTKANDNFIHATFE